MRDFIELMNEVMDQPVTQGSLVKSLRKKFELTQKELEKITGITESNISAIEHNKVELGLKRAEMFAAVFGVHPTTLLFPNGKWEKSKNIKAIEKRAEKFLKLG